jgi:hypothetical protein
MMIRQLLFLFILGSLTIQTQAQLTPIPQSLYTILDLSSDNDSRPVEAAFDGDSLTWWAIWNNAGFSLPAFVEIDLGTNMNLGGMTYLPNPAQATPKALSVEVYVTNDTADWGTPEVSRNFLWADKEDVSEQVVSFGAVEGRYVKVVFPTSQDNGGNIHTSEMVFWENATPPTGQQNQTITVTPVETKIDTVSPFGLIASASSGLPLNLRCCQDRRR